MTGCLHFTLKQELIKCSTRDTTLRVTQDKGRHVLEKTVSMRWTTGSHPQVTFPLVLYTAPRKRRVEEAGESKGSGCIEPVGTGRV